MSGVELATLPIGVLWYINGSGVLAPAAGATAYVYEHVVPPAVPSVQVQVYADEALTTPMTQPLLTDSGGALPGYVSAPATGDVGKIFDVVPTFSGVTLDPQMGNAIRGDMNVGISASLTGATAPTRYVGGTTSGHPTSGTFAVGDFVIGQDGTIWVNTVAGSPGTWTQVGGGGGGATLDHYFDGVTGPPTVINPASFATGVYVFSSSPPSWFDGVNARILSPGLYKLGIWISAVTQGSVTGEYLILQSNFEDQQLVPLDALPQAIPSVVGSFPTFTDVDVLGPGDVPFTAWWDAFIPASATGWSVTLHAYINRLAY